MSRSYFVLSDDIRTLGVHLVAARGTGKSRLLGRFVVPQDIYRGIPTIVIDPIGETIDNILTKLCELPKQVQEKIWKRIVYVDMAGRDGYVTPFPLYYRLGHESLYQVAQRPLDMIRKADAYLLHAPVHGWNPTWLIGTHAGRILAACGCQVSELEHLLTSPSEWESRFQEIEKTHPEVIRSTTFFRKYSRWSVDRRTSRTEALLIKAATFTLDPETLAMFSAPKPHINIASVIEKGQTVLIDMSGVTDLERRRFMLMWLISYVMSYIKARGAGHEHTPLSLVVDEFTLLTNFQSLAENSFEQELDELINVYSRSHRLWLTLSSQTIGQFSETMQRSLLSLGTQIFGAISDMDSAEKLANWFLPLDPFAVKYQRQIFTRSGAIDSTPLFLPIAEQKYLEAKRLQHLERFSFLIRPALSEGTAAQQPYKITIRNFDKDIYVDKALVERVKHILRKRCGLPVGPILADIVLRTSGLPQTGGLFENPSESWTKTQTGLAEKQQSTPLSLPRQGSRATLNKHHGNGQRAHLPPADVDTDDDLRS